MSKTVDKKLKKYEKFFRIYLITTILLYMIFGSVGKNIVEDSLGLELAYKALNVAIVIVIHFIFYKIFFEFFKRTLFYSENSLDENKKNVNIILNITLVVAICFTLGDLALGFYSIDTVVKALIEVNTTSGIIMAILKTKHIYISTNDDISENLKIEKGGK